MSYANVWLSTLSSERERKSIEKDFLIVKFRSEIIYFLLKVWLEYSQKSALPTNYRAVILWLLIENF